MDLFTKYPQLQCAASDIHAGLKLIIDTYKHKGKILVCGNGGSCADCEHIVGELMKGFLKKRSVKDKLISKLKDFSFDDKEFIAQNLQGALPAISLPSQSAIISAYANDVEPSMVYAQMVYGYGADNDLLICLSTSGNSKNVVYAAKVAKTLGIKTLAMTGNKDSCLSDICDVCIKAPSDETYQIQEYHLPIYHYLCAMTEEEFFSK